MSTCTFKKNSSFISGFRFRKNLRKIIRVKQSIYCQVLLEGDTVAVAGATGGTGQLIVKKLTQKGLKVKAFVRKVERAQELFGNLDNVEIRQMDFREESKANIQDQLKGVDAVCCCMGTTAFPSNRWNGGNGPRPSDFLSVKNLVAGTPANIKRFALVTSVGVTRQTEFPYCILNWFGVLKYKRAAEILLTSSGLEYTIIRPARLIGAPYTNIDVNSRLQPSGDEFTGVQLSKKDDIVGQVQCARKHLVESVIQSLFLEETANQMISICSLEGEVGPEGDAEKWKQMFQTILA